MAKGTVTKVIAGALALAGVYFIYKYFQPKKKEASPAEPTPTPTPVSTNSFPLKKGSKGNAVKSLQSLLLKIDSKSLPKYGADGDFGSETEAAVLKYLGKKSVDGQDDLNKLQQIYNSRILVFAQPNTTQPKPLFGQF